MTTTKCGAETARGKRCERDAGWGTPGVGGPCKYHAGRENGDQPPPVGDDPPAPKTLSSEATQVWKAVVSEWHLSAEERLILRGGLEAWDRYQQARQTLDREGPTVEGAAGAPKKHPAAQIARDSYREYRASVAQLGLQTEDL